MPIFESMQPKKSKKDILKASIFCLIFFLYAMFAEIFVLAPPMIGFLFVVFMDIYNKKKTPFIVAILICLVFFEATNGLPLGILSLVFLTMNYIITKKFNIIFGKVLLFVFWYVASLYLCYFLVIYIIKFFGSGLSFNLNVIFIYYFLTESILALLYERFKRRFDLL